VLATSCSIRRAFCRRACAMLPLYERSMRISRNEYLPSRNTGIQVPKAPTTIGGHLKRRRLQLRILQPEAARRLGVSTVSLSRWECDKALPTDPTIHNSRKIWATTRSRAPHNSSENRQGVLAAYGARPAASRLEARAPGTCHWTYTPQVKSVTTSQNFTARSTNSMRTVATLIHLGRAGGAGFLGVAA
jgi:DNA-binding XRE family transcriptional regulator